MTRDQDMVKLMVTALGKASRRRTRIALDLVHDGLEITRRCLIESRLDQDAACIGGGEIRKNGPDVRKGEIRIVGSDKGGRSRKNRDERWYDPRSLDVR